MYSARRRYPMPVRIRARSEKIALNRVEDCGDAGGMGEWEAKGNNVANKQDGAGCIFKTYINCLGRGCSVRCPFFYDTSAIIFDISYIFLEQAASIPDTTPCACVCCPFVLPTLLWSEKAVKC